MSITNLSSTAAAVARVFRQPFVRPTLAAPVSITAERSDTLRVVSNLNKYAMRKLTMKEANFGIFHFYHSKIYTELKEGKTRLNNWMTWLGIGMSFLAPSHPMVRGVKTSTFTRENAGFFKGYTEAISDGYEELALMTSVKKDNVRQLFNVSIPIAVVPAGMASQMFEVFYGRGFSAASGITMPESGKVIPSSVLKVNGFLSEDAILHLSEANASLRIKNAFGNAFVLFLDAELTREQAEFLTTTAWVEIRPIDVYSPIREWAMSIRTRARPPAYTVPLAKIAATVPSGGEKRTNADGVTVDENGELWYIPEEVNNISQYDAAVSTQLQGSDEVYTALDPETFEPRGTKPPAMPIFVDWVNLKFAYNTAESGRIIIKPLDRCIAAKPTHYYRVFNAPIENSNYVKSMLSYATILGAKYGHYQPTENIKVSLSSYFMLLSRNEATSGVRLPTDMNMRLLYEHSSIDKTPEEIKDLGAIPYEPIDNLLKSFPDTLKGLEDNLPVANREYSVEAVCKLVAFLRVMTKWGTKYAELHAQDSAARKVYINQGESDDYKAPELPYVAKGKFMLPHQSKVNNIMRDSPDNAILAVAAGGGKTPLAVVDFLKELSLNPKIRGLILAPGHLVSTHIEEFINFTHGRVNIIPVTSYTIVRHGFERLKAMIMNSPVNTVTISDYNVLSKMGAAQKVAYGNQAQQVFPAVEFLRQFRYDWVFCDESHYLKGKGARTQAVHRLLAEIPKKRLASGTLVSNVMSDLVKQAALLDPTLFGSKEEFESKYAAEVDKGKVTSWHEEQIRRDLKQSIVMAEARRKEWAAILPTPIAHWWALPMSEAQAKVYNDIMKSSLEDLEKKAQSNPKLKKFLDKLKRAQEEVTTIGDKPLRPMSDDDPDDEEDDDDSDPEIDDDAGRDIKEMERILSLYMQRIEQYMTAPGEDELGNLELKGDDRIAPKTKKLIELCHEHLEGVKNGSIKGKILIFVQYKRSAKAIYDALPPDLQAQAVYYTAEAKDSDVAMFKSNPRKMIMVGIETSMNTGLNLQFCSRLIRMETVWTPGAFEQGNSRIGRPNINERENRDHIYYDWLVTKGSIDITKASYLIAKIISKARFDEDDPRYAALEKPKLFKMSMDNIFKLSSSNDLAKYITAYAQYQAVQTEDYKEYRVAYAKGLARKLGKRAWTEKEAEIRKSMGDKAYDARIAKMQKTDPMGYDERVREEIAQLGELAYERKVNDKGPMGGPLEFTPLNRSGNLEDSKIMRRTPYTPGINIYGGEELGLVRYDKFMGEIISQSVDDDDAEDDDDNDTPEQKRKNQADTQRLHGGGFWAHTDYGEGEIVKVVTKKVHIKYSNGVRDSVPKMAVFIITRADTNSNDLRNRLAKATGLPHETPLEIPDPAALQNKILKRQNVKVKPTKVAPGEEPVDEEPTDTRVQLELGFGTTNDFLTMNVFNVDNKSTVSAAQALGFQFMPPHYEAKVMGPLTLKRMADWLVHCDFTMDASCSKAVALVYQHMKNGSVRGKDMYGVATQLQLRNFHLISFRPNPDPKHLIMYPVILDGHLYLCMPKHSNPSAPKAIAAMARKKPQPLSLKWMVVESSVLTRFFKTKAEAGELIKSLMKNPDYNIVNLEEVAAQFKAIKSVRNPQNDHK